ncbi:type VI secretion system contractile sheath small subunit [Serratia sp. T13T92]|jgi:type VI secretion system protein ImpB|uniref:type VI secretion system contractile sheath small subunit n=1 Tax=Serratia sp. T13T92 TaxID=3397496 RepID=UPI0039DF4AD4
MSSTQHKLNKNKSPRVQITYDVEIGDEPKVKELPLVIGVLGDFTRSDNTLRERKFLNINKDNFNEIMSSMKPQAEFLVDSILPGKEGKLPISLYFNHVDNFSPDHIAWQIEPLRKLVELREGLCDLRNRAASNEMLKEHLLTLLQQPKLISSVSSKAKDGE